MVGKLITVAEAEEQFAPRLTGHAAPTRSDSRLAQDARSEPGAPDRSHRDELGRRWGGDSFGTAFDQALEQRALREAAEAYATRHGEPGSPAYRAAWLRFRQRIRTLDDLRAAREARRRRAKLDRAQ
jgi:hypothetical protein